MSLRLRILLLFVSFAVLPMIFLGAGDYVHSVKALRGVLESRSHALAEHTARELQAAHRAARLALEAEAERPFSDATSPADAARDPVIRITVAEPRAGAESDFTCAALGSVPVVLSREAPNGETRHLVGLLPAETVVEWAPAVRSRVGKAGFVQVLDQRTGRLVLDSRCWAASAPGSLNGEPPAPHPAVLEAAGRFDPADAGPVLVAYGGDGDMVASVAAAGPEWAVAVHTSREEFIGPFRESRFLYLLLVLAALVIAGGGFLLVAQGCFRSLRVVTAAADQIELGNLRPWLPPPGTDEVGRLSMAFRKMTERLDGSIRQAELSQKLAAVGELATYLTHEIRNPLSSIRLSLQSLHQDLRAGYIPGDTTRIIELALGEVNRLDGVVRAVLDMGRPEADADGRSFHVHAAIDESLEVLRPRLRARGVELECVQRARSDLALGDAEALRGVLLNLVLNAVDALEGRTHGRIRVSTLSVGGNEIHVRVADNGPGVAPDAADSVFEPFFTTKASGNGIGLSMALRTVQAWGGTIVHEPVAAGSGAVFVVKLKLAGEPATERAQEPKLTTAEF